MKKVNVDVYDAQENVYIEINATSQYATELFDVTWTTIRDHLHHKTIFQNRYLFVAAGEEIIPGDWGEEKYNKFPEQLKQDWDQYCMKFRGSVNESIRQQIQIISGVE